jgi:hypothetical protein
MTAALVKSLIDEQLEDLEPQLMAFSHKSWLGALSLAWDAGIENCHAWTQRLFVGGEWTVVYEVKA